jgi:hypothetical protein
MEQPLDLSRSYLSSATKKKTFTIDYLTSDLPQQSVSPPFAVKNEPIHLPNCGLSVDALHPVENQLNSSSSTWQSTGNEHVVPNLSSPPLVVSDRTMMYRSMIIIITTNATTIRSM